jgi:hypothetical protein
MILASILHHTGSGELVGELDRVLNASSGSSELDKYERLDSANHEESLSMRRCVRLLELEIDP